MICAVGAYPRGREEDLVETGIMQIATRALPALGLRPCDETDQEFLQHLYTSTRDDLLALPADPIMVARLIVQQRQLQMLGYVSHYPQAQHYIVTNARRPIGRLLLNYGQASGDAAATAAEPSVHLIDIALLPEMRGRGIGSAVLRALQTSASARRWPLTLNVHKNNPRAKQLYMAHHFQVAQAETLSERLQWRDTRQLAPETAAAADHAILQDASAG